MGAGGSLIGMTGVGGDSTRCKPTSCAEQKVSCGSILDNCGGTLECGTCEGAKACDAKLHACVDKKTACESAHAACGFLTDACGGAMDCGGCPSGQLCNGATGQCQPCVKNAARAMRKDRRWLRRRALVRHLWSGAHL